MWQRRRQASGARQRSRAGGKNHHAELRRIELEQAYRAPAAEGAADAGSSRKRSWSRRYGASEAATKRIEGEAEAAQQRALAEVGSSWSTRAAPCGAVHCKGLPQIASAFKQNFGTINYTQVLRQRQRRTAGAGRRRHRADPDRGALAFDPACLTMPASPPGRREPGTQPQLTGITQHARTVSPP